MLYVLTPPVILQQKIYNFKVQYYKIITFRIC
jgi:hypothetical protein